MGIILNRSPDQHVRVGRDLYFAFAHPRIAIAFISSMVRFGPPSFDRQPMKSAIVPWGASALTTNPAVR